jgi:exonuclease SbcC
MAALSLALGLSDVVQSYAGGIRLDTLFVDEGFGSLDQESLELAIRTLIDLQESGRMVGVISHVTELKEQMEVRIDVAKGVKGSHLAVVAASTEKYLYVNDI